MFDKNKRKLSMKTVVLKNGMGSQTCHSFVNEINDIFNKQNSVKRGQRDSISKFKNNFVFSNNIFFFSIQKQRPMKFH